MKKPTKSSRKSKNPKPNKNGLRFVKDLRDLKKLIADGYHEYRIALGGTAGAIFSRKEIDFDPKAKKFYIINFIDDSEQILNQKQLFSGGYSNIGKALRLNSLIVDLKEKR